MAPASPLNVNREQLIKALEGKLAQTRQERADREKERDERNAEALDAFVKLITEQPRFFASVLQNAHDEWDTRDLDELAKSVGKQYSMEGMREVARDEELERLIRLYKLGSDESVELNVDDEVHKYI